MFRLRGHYLAIATIAVGEIVQTLMLNWDWVGAARGFFVPIKRPDSFVNFQFHQSKQTYYYIALGPPPPRPGRRPSHRALAHGILLPRHPRGPGRGGEPRHPGGAVQAAGDGAGPPALTAMGGTFYAQYILFIDPESVFPLSLSILICLMAVLGGVGTLWGPLVGAAILVPLSEGTRI